MALQLSTFALSKVEVLKNTPVGADAEYPKIIEYDGSYPKIMTKSEHIMGLYKIKINEYIKNNNIGYVNNNDEYSYYPLYGNGLNYGLEYTQFGGTGVDIGQFFKYKKSDGTYATNEWIVCDIDFDGNNEWVYANGYSEIAQWIEMMVNNADELNDYNCLIYAGDQLGMSRADIPFLNNYSDNVWWDGSESHWNNWFWFNGGALDRAKINNIYPEAGDYWYDPIGRRCDENGTILRP